MSAVPPFSVQKHGTPIEMVKEIGPSGYICPKIFVEGDDDVIQDNQLSSQSIYVGKNCLLK